MPPDAACCGVTSPPGADPSSQSAPGGAFEIDFQAPEPVDLRDALRDARVQLVSQGPGLRSTDVPCGT